MWENLYCNKTNKSGSERSVPSVQKQKYRGNARPIIKGAEVRGEPATDGLIGGSGEGGAAHDHNIRPSTPFKKKIHEELENKESSLPFCITIAAFLSNKLLASCTAPAFSILSKSCFEVIFITIQN